MRPLGHCRLGVGQASFDILERQLSVDSEELLQVRLVCQLVEHLLHRNSCAFDYGLANHDVWILDDSVLISKLFFRHNAHPLGDTESIADHKQAINTMVTDQE